MNELLDSIYQATIYDNRWLWYLEGVWSTILVSLGAIFIGCVIGIIVALIKYINKKFGVFKPGAVVVDIYLAIFRGTPVYVQLLIMYLIVLVFMPPMWVAIITFGINSGAYVAEIIRSGLESVDDGQIEAGSSLGFTKTQIMLKIILPQGFRNCLPSLFNEFIALVKETSIMGVVGVVDLTKAAERVVTNTLDVFVPYILIALIYLAIVLLLTYALKLFERRLAKSDRRQ